MPFHQSLTFLCETIHAPSVVDLVQLCEGARDGTYGVNQEHAREDHPEEIHEEIVEPKVQKFRSRINDFFVIVIKSMGGIIENKSVYLSYSHDNL